MHMNMSEKPDAIYMLVTAGVHMAAAAFLGTFWPHEMKQHTGKIGYF